LDDLSVTQPTMSKHCRKLKALTTTSDLVSVSVFLQTPEGRSHLMVSLAQLQYDPAVFSALVPNQGQWFREETGTTDWQTRTDGILIFW